MQRIRAGRTLHSKGLPSSSGHEIICQGKMSKGGSPRGGKGEGRGNSVGIFSLEGSGEQERSQAGGGVIDLSFRRVSLVTYREEA